MVAVLWMAMIVTLRRIRSRASETVTLEHFGNDCADSSVAERQYLLK